MKSLLELYYESIPTQKTGKSILNSDVDLKGDKKETWMYSETEFDDKYEQSIDIRSKDESEAKLKSLKIKTDGWVNQGSGINTMRPSKNDREYNDGVNNYKLKVGDYVYAVPKTHVFQGETGKYKVGDNEIWQNKYSVIHGWKPNDSEIVRVNKVGQSLFETIVENAIRDGKYQKAIEDGRMTAQDAKVIIESAGLEVPIDILKQCLPTK